MVNKFAGKLRLMNSLECLRWSYYLLSSGRSCAGWSIILRWFLAPLYKD